MRFRLLPIAIFALVLLLGAKIADVWSGFAALSVTKASAQASSPAATEPSAPVAAAAAPNSAPAASTAPAPTTPATPAASAQSSAAPIRIATAATPKLTDPSDFPDDPTLYTPADMDVLQKLAKRRAELEAWAGDLAMREKLLKATEGKLEERLAELKTVQTSVKGLLRQHDQEQEAKLKSLVKIYETMKPKDAARIFEQLEMDILLDVVERMKEAKVAPILSAMNPEKARTVTEELAQRRRMGAQAAALPAAN
jgi:flagellar motility protein MotE (MotC chaperone)